jgi:hypothetical protein
MYSDTHSIFSCIVVDHTFLNEEYVIELLYCTHHERLYGLCTKTLTFPQSFVQEGILHKKSLPILLEYFGTLAGVFAPFLGAVGISR